MAFSLQGLFFLLHIYPASSLFLVYFYDVVIDTERPVKDSKVTQLESGGLKLWPAHFQSISKYLILPAFFSPMAGMSNRSLPASTGTLSSATLSLISILPSPQRRHMLVFEQGRFALENWQMSYGPKGSCSPQCLGRALVGGEGEMQTDHMEAAGEAVSSEQDEP